jgi:hypothetical protein
MPEYEQGLAGPVFADGLYDFQCVDAGEKTAQGSGNVMIELQLDCFNADFTDKVRVVDRLVFTPKSYWKIDSFRKATGEKISQNQKVSFEAEDCIDRKGRLVLKTTTYNGNARNEVDYYIEPDDGTQQPSSASSPAPPQAAPKGSVPKSNQPF